MRLTQNQRTVLRYLKRFPGDAHPSGHMRTRDLRNPGPVLARLAERGLVEALGTTPEGRCYRITPAGSAALEGTQAA